MRPKIIAHRGASHLAPENTVAAFRLAAAMGVDGIEFDTLLTADNQLVIHHEYITDLHANANEVIPWCTLDQLRALDFGSWKSPLYAGEKIPTFAEALEACSDVDTIQVEFKSPLGANATTDQDAFAERILEEVESSGLADKIIVTSFNHGILSRVKKLSFATLCDLAAFGLLIGQCVGRWGNFVNGEAHGGATSLPWGMSIDGGDPVHPTFLYESLWNLIGFIALHFYSKKRKFPGEMALLYVAWYGLGRAWIEGLRTDSLYLGTLRVSQVLAAVSCIIAIAVLVRQYNRIKVRKAFYVPPVEPPVTEAVAQPAEDAAQPAPAENGAPAETAEAASGEAEEK